MICIDATNAGNSICLSHSEMFLVKILNRNSNYSIKFSDRYLTIERLLYSLSDIIIDENIIKMLHRNFVFFALLGLVGENGDIANHFEDIKNMM